MCYILYIGSKGEPEIPQAVVKEGFDLSELKRSFNRAQNDLPVLAFVKKPTLKFYKELHNFLMHWQHSRDAGVTAIGKFYNAIDPYLRQKGLIHYNAYRYIQQQIRKCSTLEDTLSLPYQSHVKDNVRDFEEVATDEGQDLVHADNITTPQNTSEENKADMLQKALRKVQAKMAAMEKSHRREIEQIQDINHDLYEEILKKDSELEDMSKDDTSDVFDDISDEITAMKKTDDVLGCTVEVTKEEAKSGINFCYQTKQGRTYSFAIRKLYYVLLAANIPPGKIAMIIKEVLHHLLPGIDVSKIQLPKHSSALYMRREELATVNSVQKAIMLTEKGSEFHINTDGTTLQQRKIGATAVNGLVLSVNELPSGSAENIAKDISRELENLREIARALCLPNADSINWSVVASTTSDSAATQKKFNEMAAKLREQDQKKFGNTSLTAGKELITNFCAMHLGVNLRKAFLEGSETELETGQKRYFETDTFVYEFCKIFGTKGVPEYGIGCTSFQDYLSIQMEAEDDGNYYYEKCIKVKLDRQVGSRYFVSACNAAKAFFLSKAAQEYLMVFGKNKLERDVLTKLKDQNIRANTKADGLMFYHIYADLVTLAKCTELNKSALDMTTHYFELDCFLEHLSEEPEIAFDSKVKAYTTETRLYSSNSTFNHREKVNNRHIYETLFTADPLCDTLVLKKLSKGAISMRKKLKDYARDYLPSGRYWHPPKHVADVLRKIKPSNDICESILGLNDWLQTTMPSVSQLTKRNLIEVKKNKTMQWFSTVPEQKQKEYVKMAIERKSIVKKSDKEYANAIAVERQSALQKALEKHEMKNERYERMKGELSNVMVLVNWTQLETLVRRITGNMQLKKSKKDKMTLELLKTQLKLRQILIGEPIKFYFTKGGKKIVLTQLLSSFQSMMDRYPLSNPQAMSAAEKFDYVITGGMVGEIIEHKFLSKEANEEKWYKGQVIAYDEGTQEYEIEYDGEEESCKFDLAIDCAMGYIKMHD